MFKLLLFLLALAVSACSVASRKNDLFTGEWVGNEAESVMLPGQHVPKNMVAVMEDDGRSLWTAQIFTNDEGKEVRRLEWGSVCDGKASPVLGVDPPGVATLSCRRIGAGAFEMELKDRSGYSHMETCRMSAGGRKHTCTGTATLSNGSKHEFVFVFDRK